MPQFILCHGDAQSEGGFNALPPFVRGYIECIFFTSASPSIGAEEWAEYEARGEEIPEGSIPCDAYPSDIEWASFLQVLLDCEQFQAIAAPLLEEAYARGDYDAEQAGRDFWFTRCGHGVGFWDREQLRDGLREKLSALCGWRTDFDNIDAIWDGERIYL